MKLFWSARAKSDLVEIARFIARDNPLAAREWAAKLVKRARDAARNPAIGRVLPEVGRREIRELLLKNYRIVYQVGAKRVEVLTVFESHRRLNIEEKG